MRIYYAIENEDEKEVESLLRDAKTDINWTNEFVLVSVIL